MVDDLVFRKLPLDGPPNVLVFGEPVEPTVAAYALGTIALPAFMALGAALATMPPHATAAGAIALPAFMATGTAQYASAVSRPLMGKLSSAWQVARQIEAGVLATHQAALRTVAGRATAWQKAAPLARGTATAWQDALRVRAAAALRYQAALQLEMAMAQRHQEALRLQRAVSARWQEAVRLTTATVGIGHQDADRLQRAVRSAWQEAIRAQSALGSAFGKANLVDVGVVSRWQAAMAPLPGHSLFVPPVPTPCYVPSTTLVFRDKQKYSTTLIFRCQGHGTTAPPDEATLLIPLLKVYMTTHYMDAVLLPSLERVPLEDVTIETADGTPHWKLTASGPIGLMDLFPINGAPKLVRVTVDGLPWVFAISPAGRSRAPGQRRARITGRSVPALAGARNMADQIWLNNAPATAQQLVTEALQLTDVAVDWQIPDWVVPAGAWSFKGKPLAAAVRIAEAVGAVLQSHPTLPTLQFLPRYKRLPWEWASVVPDVSIASAALAADDYEPEEQPSWEAVYVFGGANQGVGRRVVRGGTAGTELAPQQVDDLITDHVAAVERGRSVLGAGGMQAMATMSLPILVGPTLPGVLRVNQLLEVVEPTETWRGLVRGVTLRAGPSEVRQSVRVERHFA